jgi:signal transduction histidine kinase
MTREERLPPDTESRLGEFTALMATAISNAEARAEVERLAEEQAALRRVATLVARESSPMEVFGAVTEEAWRALDTEAVGMLRFDSDVTATLVAQSHTPWDPPPLGTRFTLEGENIIAQVLRTGRAVRVDDWASATGQVAAMASGLGIRSSVATPIVVDGRLWGTMVAVTSQSEPLPGDTESRIGQFTELVATAIANAGARSEVEQLADEQAALRRVATLVAEGVSPQDLFEAVAVEVGRLLPVGGAEMGRFEPDGSVTMVASWGARAAAFPTGKRWPAEGANVPSMVLQTGGSARLDDFSSAATDPIGVAARETGTKSAVGSPIIVDGDLWGVVTATSNVGPLPPDSDARLASFTELVATAIANAENLAELAASRRRIVAAADEARRRIERDLHDGAQQRLVSLALSLRAAEADVPSELDELRATLSRTASGLVDAVEELQEISRGIHPAILSKGGIVPALKTLAGRAAIPVELNMRVPRRLPESVEVAAYYVVSEALTNISKHARASVARVAVELGDRILELAIRDDGAGGADPRRGSGLIGLRDRVEAIGGTLDVESPAGAGTSLLVALPVK